MKKTARRKGNWYAKRPSTAERVETRLASIRASLGDTLGGAPELTTHDFAAAVGTLKPIEQLIIGAKYGHWPRDISALRSATTHRSWTMWARRDPEANINPALNARLAGLVVEEFLGRPVALRERAKAVQVDYRRWQDQLAEHHADVARWLQTNADNALENMKARLRR